MRANNRQLLNFVVGNQGTALGRKNFDPAGKPDGDPCIIVYMPHKIADALLADNLRVPAMLESKDGALQAPTDVVVTTRPPIPKADVPLDAENQKLVETLQWLNGELDFIGPGAHRRNLVPCEAGARLASSRRSRWGGSFFPARQPTGSASRERIECVVSALAKQGPRALREPRPGVEPEEISRHRAVRPRGRGFEGVSLVGELEGASHCILVAKRPHKPD